MKDTSLAFLLSCCYKNTLNCDTIVSYQPESCEVLHLELRPNNTPVLTLSFVCFCSLSSDAAVKS